MRWPTRYPDLIVYDIYKILCNPSDQLVVTTRQTFDELRGRNIVFFNAILKVNKSYRLRIEKNDG